MGKLFDHDSLKLTKDEKKNIQRLNPKPSMTGSVNPRVAKTKNL